MLEILGRDGPVQFLLQMFEALAQVPALAQGHRHFADVLNALVHGFEQALQALGKSGVTLRAAQASGLLEVGLGEAATGAADLHAAGGLRDEWLPPSLVSISDHINFSGANPLIGRHSDDRFVPMTNAYDAHLRSMLRHAAQNEEIELHEGVYMWFSGPSFETPAEIRAAKILGADLVGMSTAPEVILARLHGLTCVAVSLVTNFAAGLAGGDPNHAETKEVASEGSAQFKQLLRAFIRAHDPAIA